ncbi:DNA-binding MarR family transcriptional regulator [Rhizobium azibense]|uniref:DNA-binding MarR family transcriptional regulator n=1 Tax=Rhizobium azibense TaxID=1136135 RepID=A0A4R3QJA0_9HYPH|nr:MarR family winged helix-turn-helix transcriptional regulator [Rhizobium azibense]TCU21950.1 DNA-binding MarR family transcriptional regulator [Rhizobium azibense]
MVDDVVRTLGFSCMGSRFRRIGQPLEADAQEIIEEYGLTIQAGQYPFVAALDGAAPLAIGKLAQAAGITQPGPTRTVSQSELGLVDMQAAPYDQRKSISLTRKEKELVDYSKQSVRARISAAVADLFGNLNGPILAQFAAIQDGLAEAALAGRAAKEETT